MNRSDPIHLRGGGTSVVLDTNADGIPIIVHWGTDLGHSAEAELRSIVEAAKPQRVSGGLDVPARLTLLPLESQGWLHEPGLEGSRAAGVDYTPSFDITELEATEMTAHIVAVDPAAALSIIIDIAVTDSGLVKQRLTVTNDAEVPYLLSTAHLTFPIPKSAAEILDTTGRHLKERTPQRHAFTVGEHVRNSRRGRPGADATLFILAGETGFGFRKGLVHGVHVAWSGNHHLAAIRTPAGESFLTGGELLLPGEGALGPGESYETPWVYGSWGEGMDDLAARFHDHLRARDTHPTKPRPVTLNTWEAVYFDHDFDRLARLAEKGASLGVERFVLDDGWFRKRRDDTAGLGDWYVDETVWPDGLTPLIKHVRDLGMEFGLWVEPEMANPDSELARTHPEWLLRPTNRWPVASRAQQVVNLAHPEAYAYLFERLDRILTDNDISYLKWDHNRDLLEATDQHTGRAGVHATTHALYRLLDELRAHHPNVEIESCASGGARVDLGILDRTDRIWTSDCIDPLERLDNQQYTNLLVPNELMGAHVSAHQSHSTNRILNLNLRAGTAIFGHFGIEWDISDLDIQTTTALSEWVSLYKRNRHLFHTGRSIHADTTDPSIDIRGVVDADQRQALFTLTQRSASVTYPVGRFTLPGLHHDTVYEVKLAPITPINTQPGQSPLAWANSDAPILMNGKTLANVGLQTPVLFPESLLLIQVRATR